MAAEALGTDVLVAGAGQTGLVLAAVLHAHGVRARVIDQQPGPGHESRALVVHPRTLELLATLGLADPLVERGRTSSTFRPTASLMRAPA